MDAFRFNEDRVDEAAEGLLNTIPFANDLANAVLASLDTDAEREAFATTLNKVLNIPLLSEGLEHRLIKAVVDAAYEVASATLGADNG